jgi:hypothetical protein
MPVTSEIPLDVDAILRSKGEPIDGAARAVLEPRFKHDVSDVRVHTDHAAAGSARALDAVAYTVGNHVVFDEAQYRPRSYSGLRLLAHELTHVVQQRAAAGAVTASPASAERAAETAERQIVGGAGAMPMSAANLAIARKPRSLTSTVNPASMTDAELQREINAIREWLRSQSESSVENNQLAVTLGQLGQELLRRHPGARPPEARAGAPIAFGLLSTAQVAAAESAVLAGSGAAAPGVGAATTGVGAAEGAGAVGAGIGATVAAALAFVVVLLWPSSVMTGAEERRLLERAREEQRARERGREQAEPRSTTQTRRCSEAEFNELYPLVRAGCDKPRGCTMQGDTCASATAKVAAGFACIEARENLQRKCFRRGDDGYEGHMEQIAQAYAALRECQRIMMAKCT